MANVFDQFDPAPTLAAPPPPGNVFDQFDPPAAPASGRGKSTPVQVPNPFADDGSGPPMPLSFADRFGHGTMAREADTSSPLGQALRARADERLIGISDAGSKAEAAASGFSNTLGLNLPRNAAAGIATAAGALGVPGYSPRTFDENYQLAKDRDDALARQNPKSAIAGNVAGVGAGMALLPGLSGAATLRGRALQAAATGAGYGAIGEFADTKDLGDAARGGAIGGLAAGVLTPAIEKAAPVVIGMLGKGLKVRNDNGELTTTAKALLSREGIDPASLPPDFETQLASTFKAKGETPAALREAQAGEFGIPVSRGQATGDADALGLERTALAGGRGSRAQGVAQEFDAKQADAIAQARQNIGARAGGDVPYDNPSTAAEAVADRAREAYRASAQAADAEQAAGERALEGVRGYSPLDTADAGSVVAQGIREKAAASKAGYQAAYQDLAQTPGTFTPGALDRMGDRVASRLGVEYPIDSQLTPAASRAMADLGNLPTLLGTPDGSGPSLSAVDQARKRLVTLYGGTRQNPTDRRAMGKILSEFDNHVEDALGSGLFGHNPAQAADAAAGRAGSSVAADVPFPASDVGSTTGGSKRAPESLIPFLGRKGGIALDGDARAGDLQRIQTGHGPLARRNGRSLDDLRVPLMEEGYLPPDADGGMSRNITDELHSLIRQERGGTPVYRAADQTRASGLDRGGRLADDSAAYADQVAAHTEQVGQHLQDAGYHPREVDPVAMRRAGESVMLGEHSDPLVAYESAVLRGGPSSGRAPASEAVPFPGAGQSLPATSDALPGGDLAPAETMRKARSLFSSYQRTFKPQGAGDDVGRAMQAIVDRSAEPVEVARMAYGGNKGLNRRVADRVKSVLGEDSSEWLAHQQGFISSIVNGRDMRPSAIAGRINDALAVDRSNSLASRILTKEQIAGLWQFKTSVQAAEKARADVPEWLSTLGRSDFDPNRVTGNLFGSGVPGARTGSAQYAGGLKKMLGPESPEWAGLRRAAWDRLTLHGTTSNALPARQMADRIRSFTDGPGSGLARQMYSQPELAEMRRFATAIQNTVRPDGSPMPEGRAHAIAAKAFDGIAAMIGLKTGGIGGAAAMYGARLGQKYIQEGRNARIVQRALQGGAPQVRVPLPPANYRIGTGVGLAAGQL